jgi:hypothetical protein
MRRIFGFTPVSASTAAASLSASAYLPPGVSAFATANPLVTLSASRLLKVIV